MPTEQVLKKKLKGVRTTRKITKAMKTAATVKYSRLNAVFSGYSEYATRCQDLYKSFEKDFINVFPSGKPEGPACCIIMAGNKGMCGSFNIDLFSYAHNVLSEENKEIELVLCGEKAISDFAVKEYNIIKKYVFDDVPKYSEAAEFYTGLCSLLSAKGYSSVKIIYPQYVNMMKQLPCVRDLFNQDHSQMADGADELFVPDKNTIIKNSAEKIITSMLYGFILETAIGAQAATIMNMRSAYDTAVEYEEKLESEINRKRQSRVTADVIETSAEYSREEEW